MLVTFPRDAIPWRKRPLNGIFGGSFLLGRNILASSTQAIVSVLDVSSNPHIVDGGKDQDVGWGRRHTEKQMTPNTNRAPSAR